MKTNTLKNEFTEAFAQPIWELVKSIKSKPNDKIERLLKSALNQVLRKWTDGPVDMVSEEVIKLFKDANLKINPCDLSPSPTDLKILGVNSKNKSLLVWEHTTPVGEFIKELVKCSTQNDILQSLNNYSGTCLITRKEDDILNKLGLKNKRPGGWEKCYKDAGIIVHKC